jgi:CO dehydrogenase maturation factor
MLRGYKLKLAVSGKGGVGKSTIAGVLAQMLYEDGYTVTAIDCDPDANLASVLGCENPKPISELRDLIRERAGEPGGAFKVNPEVDDIAERYGVDCSGVRLLAMGTIERGGEGCMCPSSAFLTALLRHSLRSSDVLVMDMEAGIEHLGRGTSKYVDVLLVVVEPGQRSIDTLRKIKRLAADLDIKKVISVLNKDRGDDRARELVEDTGVPLLSCIPFDPKLVEADILGKPPIESGGPAVEAIRELKDRVVEGI